ncbi:sugar ABC transporter substrate-binding protein [Ruminococcus sp. OA3]|nr:sugar ABC transporter substrate-binding protein [Ruminococcus sp. OA3]
MTYIGTDNYQGGVVGGEFINEKYPDGAKICILSGTVGNPAGDARIDGFVEAISANPKLEVVSNQPTDWSRDQGYSVMQNVLTANPDIDAVYCAADLIALGAAEEGSCVIGSVAQFPADMSKEAIDACITVLEGGTVEHEINTDVKVLPEQ